MWLFVGMREEESWGRASVWVDLQCDEHVGPEMGANGFEEGTIMRFLCD